MCFGGRHLKKSWLLTKKEIAFLLAAALLSAGLSGCQYESFDDYLRALGMKDPVAVETVATTESVSEVSSMVQNKYFSSVLLKIAEDLRGGANFSDSLAKYPKIFDNTFNNKNLSFL